MGRVASGRVVVRPGVRGDGPGPGGTRRSACRVRARPSRGDRPGPPLRGGTPYFQEASEKFSWVSGLTAGGLTFSAKAMDGGELEMGSPGRMSMIWLFSSW